MTDDQVATLARELAFEVFHRGIPRWRVLLDVADELLAHATLAARNQVTRALERAGLRVA